MNFKIDTKDKFSVLIPLEARLYDNMAIELEETCIQLSNSSSKNLILNLTEVNLIDTPVLNTIQSINQYFYTNNRSFVLTCLNEYLKTIFVDLGLADSLNITPTESEAWDIVQMEEIERELFADDED